MSKSIKEFRVVPGWCQEVYGGGEVIRGWFEAESASYAEGWLVVSGHSTWIETRTEAFETPESAYKYAKTLAKKHKGKAVKWG